MLAIRLQRTGRSGNTQFRVIVQDSRFSPTRGRVVAYLGSYDPHSKAAALDSAKAAQYLENGAQPSDRVARLFQKEGIKLPDWVKVSEPKQRVVRHPEKRRSTRPAGTEASAAPETAPAEETTESTEAGPTAETPAAETTAPELTPDTEEPAGTPDIEAAPTEPEPAAEPAAETAPAETSGETSETEPAK